MHTFSAVVLPLLHVFAATYADGFLSLDINDCFERVSIGKRLNSSDVTKTIYNTSLKQCSNECERILCNAYSYGVNVNGNGTCLLSLDLPKLGPYDDPEYDLFMKILQCRLRTTCFNKLVGGRRLNDKHIQRTLPVDSKGDCELFCEYEKEFRCEGFNFRYDVELNTYSSCQLTSVPSTKLDLSLDFQSDLDYDFFEKNVNASPSCRYLDLENPHGLGRQWGIKPDLTSLWQGFSPSLYQRNDVGYGNENAYYDGGVLSTAAAVVPEYDGVNLLIRPNNDLPGGLGPTLSTADRRLLVSTDECFIKARTGHHLQRENIIKSINAPSLYGCETACANEQTFTCNIFSYRYTFTSSMDNCHMGDKMIRQLDIFRDLVPDRDCDVFARNDLSQPGCQPARNWDTDCFERIRSGLTFEVSIVKFSVQTDNLHECELICLHVKHFTCRLFSFRRVTPVIGKRPEDNCYLTDYPVIEMDPAKHFVQDADCDVYNRGSYGRGCELDKPWPGRPAFSGWDQTPTVLTTYRPQYGVPPPPDLSYPSDYRPKYGPPSQSPTLQFFPVVPPSQPPQFFPTVPPSQPPQFFPTVPPTQSPQFFPAVTPTQPPQFFTTVTPTQPPQFFPTVPPTQPPQFFPTVPPSQPPQFFPAVTPTQSPQFYPAVPPSQSPQFFPAVTPSQSPQYFPVGPPSSTPPAVAFDTSTKSTGTYTPSQPPTTFFHVPAEYTPVSIKPAGGVFNDLFDPYGPSTRKPTIYGATNKPACYVNFGNTARLLPSAIRKVINVESEQQCKTECDRARDGQRFRCSTLSYFGGYCELSDVEMRDLRPNQHFDLDQRFLLYAWDFDERDCFGGSPAAKSPAAGSFPGGLEWTWMRFTVNGQPCRSGSYCTQNADIGVWSCPVDHGEWDYCCRPDHKCGYSEGINYPWCHVGKSTEQWRPCSDKYFPSTDGSPQTWPVTYIHHTGPPSAPPTGSPPPSDGPPFLANGTQPATIHEQSLVDQFLSIFSLPSLLPPPLSSSTALPSSSSTALPSSSSTALPSSSSTALPSSSATTLPSSSSNVNGRLVSSPDDGYRRHVADLVPGFRVVDVTTRPPAATRYRLHSHGNTDRLSKGKP